MPYTSCTGVNTLEHAPSEIYDRENRRARQEQRSGVLHEAVGMWCLMLQWALDISRTRKARRAAVAAIAPIVEGSRHRLGGISDVAWSDPYVVGFLVMLISIVAKLESSKISGDALCLVQCRAWEEITATESDAMAEQLLILSADRNRDFEFGCRNAAAFSAILFGTGSKKFH